MSIETNPSKQQNKIFLNFKKAIGLKRILIFELFIFPIKNR